MKLVIIFFVVIFCCISIHEVIALETYMYEKQNFYGLGRRLIPKPKMIINIMSNRDEYPEPLPTTAYVAGGTFRSIYQGVRGENDTRVFRRRFEHVPKTEGQHILCEGMFNCSITFLAVESTEAIPVLLRGGAGYTYFTALVKAKPGRELKGQVRAYCKKQDQEEKLKIKHSVRAKIRN